MKLAKLSPLADISAVLTTTPLIVTSVYPIADNIAATSAAETCAKSRAFKRAEISALPSAVIVIFPDSIKDL
jgi:hypothetical protein